MKREGDHLILDNGAYEGKQDRIRLLHAIDVYSPDVVVLPDFYMESWQKTWRESSDFLDHWYGAFKCEWAYCPQTTEGNIIGWVEGLTRALQDERIGWICLPRALGTDVVRDVAVRANVCKVIRGRGKKVHALGMLKGSVAELELLRAAGANSIDSNAPVWRGWCGWPIEDERWPETPVNYECEFAEKPLGGRYPIDELILENLEACGINVNSRVGR